VETLKSLCLTATAKDMDAEHLSSLVMKIEWSQMLRHTVRSSIPIQT
jgi:hypothetical protein